MASEDNGPFRHYPWPLERARDFLRFVRLRRATVRGPRRFIHGDVISVAKNADIRSPNIFQLGHHVSIGKNFTCEADLFVGNHVLISSNVSVIGNDHPFEDPSLTVYESSRRDDSVVHIGSDVLIGFGTIIVGSVSIGDGCIVGAGAVVIQDLPPYSVCVGVPARVVRQRYPLDGPNLGAVE